MPPGRMVKLSLHSRASQVAILGFSVSVTLFTLCSFFDTYAILADSNATQGCHEIKAIMAFSFLIWILRNNFAFSVHAYL